MSVPVIDNASTQITDKALIELVRRLDPFFRAPPQRMSPPCYAFRQINVATIASGASSYKVPDMDWSVGSGPAPVGITFASGIWTITVPGIYVVAAGCRFATSDPATVGGILNFSLFVPGGNLMDTQTSLPVPTATLFASTLFEANPANSMLIDTGRDLADNEIHHEFNNGTDVDCDVGYVNVSIWRIGASPA